jgi:IPTL-CTERM motif
MNAIKSKSNLQRDSDLSDQNHRPNSSEPNEAGGGTENFAAMNAFAPGEWQDVPDGLPADYVGIIEPDAAKVPTVSQWGLVVLVMMILIAGSVVFGRRRSLAA